MEGAIFDCPPEWMDWLPPETVRTGARQLAEREWPLLVLTGKRWPFLNCGKMRCGILLAPGDGDVGRLSQIRTGCVITYGLSPRDSLTLSSLAEPTLCVQRALPRPDGGVVEPGEYPLPRLPEPAERLLPLLGLRLLQLPQTGAAFPW